MLDGSSNKVFEQWALDMLYQWHLNDPVSTKEINRNNVIYNYQSNRNPYVDHPEYVVAVWGNTLSTPTYSVLANVSVYPNPTSIHKINIESEHELDEIQLININGQLMQSINKPVSNNHTYTLENLPKGFYFLKLSSENQSVVKKIIVN